MTDDATAAARGGTADDGAPVVDRDAIDAAPRCADLHRGVGKRRRRQLDHQHRTAAERLSRWMDDSGCHFEGPPREPQQPLSAFRRDRTAPPSDGENDRREGMAGIHRRALDGSGRASAPSSSLPVLLAEREAFVGGAGPRSRIDAWQRHLVARPKKAHRRKRGTPTTTTTTTTHRSAMTTRLEKPLDPMESTVMTAEPPTRYEFRTWHRRSIPFTRLGTPRSEAVLGLDRTGSYVITLGDLDVPCDDDDGRGPNSVACLALRMYGVPSPAALRLPRKPSTAGRLGRTVATPLLMTAPLHAAPHSEFHSLTARTPTLLCLSSDGEVGVAIVRDPVPLFQRMDMSGLRPVVAMVVFPLPRHVSMASPVPERSGPCLSTLRLKNPRTSMSDREADIRKVMWKVHRLPQEGIQGDGDGIGEQPEVVEAPGYLLVLRQENRCCYRLTWIKSASFRQASDGAMMYRAPPPEANRPPRDASSLVGAVLTPVVDDEGSGWTASCSDRFTGIDLPITCRTPKAEVADALRVVGERWLRLEAIMADVVRRRPKFAPPLPPSVSSPDGSRLGEDSSSIGLENGRLPLFSCDVVQVSDGGESLRAVICFMPCPRKRFMYAVFVEVLLFAQEPSYRELKWLKRSPLAADRDSLPVNGGSVSVEDDEARLTRLAETLSLNERMSLEQVGPYSIAPEPLRDWSALCTAGTTEPDEWTVRDPDPSRWTPARPGPGGSSRSVPDAIPYDAIYPDCQVVNNRAVLRQTPVRSLTSRSSATEIVYG